MRAPARAAPLARAALLAALAVVAAAAATGCDARRSEALGSMPRLDTAQQERGEVVFMRWCHQCHPGGEAGLGPSLNDKPAPGFLVKAQVRHGLGAMPSFTEREIGEADLEALIAYVKARRERPAPPPPDGAVSGAARAVRR